MSLPFPSTIARDRVIANARHLEAEGTPKGLAYAQAFNEARKNYFKRYPEGLLPDWLSVDRNKRRREDYTADGKPFRAQPFTENPAPRRSVQVSSAARLYTDFTGHEADEYVTVNNPGIRFKVGFIVGHVLGFELDTVLGPADYRFAPNDKGGLPALTVSHTGRDVAFIGGDYGPLLQEGLDKSKITAIMYRTVRDGRTENYRHPFAKFAQPALSVIDARTAKMSGGSYRFTDRGFVDTRRN